MTESWREPVTVNGDAKAEAPSQDADRMRFVDAGAALGALVARKNAAYGDSVRKSAEIMRVLYPEGIRPDQYVDALLIVRILDKLARISTARGALGEDPYQDIGGYGLRGMLLHQEGGER